MFVSIQPGSMALTRIPCLPTTAPNALAHIEMPPFTAPYADWYGEPTWAEIELVQPTAPPWPSLTICLAPSVVTSHVPRRFVSDRLSQSSIEVLSHSMKGLIPAFDTT